MINRISVSNLFWGYIQKYLVSFGNPTLPKNIHFTIAYNDGSPDINFHITKNIHVIPKPQVKIALIDKKLLEAISPSLVVTLLYKMIKPLDMALLNRRNPNGLVFISLNNLHSSALSEIFTNRFQDISKIKDTKLKIKGDIKKRIELFLKDKELREMIINNIIEIPLKPKSFEQGLLVSRRNYYFLISIKEKWYTIQQGVNPIDMLKMLIEPNLFNHLVSKINEAILRLKDAETYRDVKDIDVPIRLVLENIEKNQYNFFPKATN